jgi:hypothetical protein
MKSSESSALLHVRMQFKGDVGISDDSALIKWPLISNSDSLRIERLCGVVIRVPGYSSRGPGSIPGATRLSEK